MRDQALRVSRDRSAPERITIRTTNDNKHGQQTTINGQRTTINGQRSTDNGQRTTDNGQRSTDNDQRTTDNGQRSTINAQRAARKRTAASPGTSHRPSSIER